MYPAFLQDVQDNLFNSHVEDHVIRNESKSKNEESKLYTLKSRILAEKQTLFLLQGVSQYFGHLEICNFSASEMPKIKIVDIFEKPGRF